MGTDGYSSPLSERYASREMQYIFSQDMKFKTWRRLWIALAETEMELGLSQNGRPVITKEQIDELGEALSSMDGIVSVRFVSAGEAWEEFADAYLSRELAASFDANPLADSANYEVTVGLGADTRAVREQILKLAGVRRLADRYEQKESQNAAGLQRGW